MSKTATEIADRWGLGELALKRWADELAKAIGKEVFTKMSITRTYEFGGIAIAAAEIGDKLVVKRVVTAAEESGVIHGEVSGTPEVRADMTSSDTMQVAKALRASLEKAGLPTNPHALTLVPFADLMDKVPEYAWLIDKVVRHPCAIYDGLDELEERK